MPEESSLRTIDINDADLPEGPVTVIDKEADAFEIPPAPPAGVYRLKLFLAERGHQLGALDPKRKAETAYYMSFLEARIVEPEEYKGRRLLPNVTTTVFSGSKTSQTATLCNKILAARGSKQRVEGKRTAKWVVGALNKLLALEPVVPAECDWEAYSPNEEGKKGKMGRTIVTGMSNFPQAGDGTRLNYVEDRTHARCYARLAVVRWLDKYEPAAQKAEAPAEDLGEALAEQAPEPKVEDDDFAALAGLSNGDVSL